MRPLAFALGAAALSVWQTEANAPTMSLHILPEETAKERGAQCLDHTPAGYYLREQDPDKWVIFLEGGGLCVEPIDCIVRAHQRLGSSKYWDPTTPPEGPGPTSLNADFNPFANFSHVWVPYCSGDTWLGGSAKSHLSLLGLQMSGHLIIETLVDHLLNTTSMRSATHVLLTGSSAGGIGTYHHTDWLADTLQQRAEATGSVAPYVAGLPLEGMFFPEKMPVLYEQFKWGNTAPDDAFEARYLDMFEDPWLPPACVAASKAEGFHVSKCFDVSKQLLYTKAPLFIGMNRFDLFIVEQLGLCLSCGDGMMDASTDQGRYLRFYGARMNETIIHINRAMPHIGWFVPSEYEHDGNFYDFFVKRVKTIQGKTFKAALEAWFWRKENVLLVEPTCNEDGPCPHPDESTFVV